MRNKIEVRVDTMPKSNLDVYFWQNDQRSDVIHLDGGSEDVQVHGSFITESLIAWAELKLQKRTDKTGWVVEYKTNAVDKKLHIALEKIKRNIEEAIRKGIGIVIDITDDLNVEGWNILANKQ